MYLKESEFSSTDLTQFPRHFSTFFKRKEKDEEENSFGSEIQPMNLLETFLLHNFFCCYSILTDRFETYQIDLFKNSSTLPFIIPRNNKKQFLLAFFCSVYVFSHNKKSKTVSKNNN